MGRSIDLYSYDYEKLTNKLLEVCKTEDRGLVENILKSCGNIIGDRYVVLNQEFWEGSSCYYNVATVFEKLFKVDNIFGEVFCTSDDEELDRQELIQAMEMYEIEEMLGFEIDNSEEDEG